LRSRTVRMLVNNVHLQVLDRIGRDGYRLPGVRSEYSPSETTVLAPRMHQLLQ
jgi:hypothetical protein